MFRKLNLTIAEPTRALGHALRRLMLCTACLVTPLLVHAQSLDEIRTASVTGDIETALRQVQAKVAAQPDSVEARLLEGVILTRMGHSERAIEAFKALARDRPDVAEPHNNLAVLYAKTGQFDAARLALERAVELEPRYGVAQENLGDVYAKLASLAYQRAATLGGGSSRAKRKARIASELVGADAPPSQGPKPARPIEAEVRTQSSPSAAKAQALPAGGTPKRETTAATEAAVARAPPPASEPASAARPIAAPRTPTVQVSATATGCYYLSGLTTPEAWRAAAAWVRARNGESSTIGAPNVSSSAAAKASFLVFVPPLADRAAATVKFKQLQDAGVSDISRISRGEYANAIALGVFSIEAGAQRRTAALHKLGYPEVRYAARGVPPRSGARQTAPPAALLIELPKGETLVTELTRAFPKAELKPHPCG